MNCDDTTPIKALLLAGARPPAQSESTENPTVFKKQCKTEQDFSFALTALSNIQALKVFDLSHSLMGPRAARMFAMPLMRNQNIQVLNFSKCRIEGVHAKLLFVALKANNTMLSIDMSFNPL